MGDKQKLQDAIDKLVRWSEKWQMLFNFENCKCIHTGPGQWRIVGARGTGARNSVGPSAMV